MNFYNVAEFNLVNTVDSLLSLQLLGNIMCIKFVRLFGGKNKLSLVDINLRASFLVLRVRITWFEQTIRL